MSKEFITMMGTLDIQAAKDDKSVPTFTMTAYNGGEMNVAGFNLPVVIDLAGLTIEKQTIPCRQNHDENKGVGHTTKVSTANYKITAEGLISRDTSFARDVANSGKRGFPWEVSVGCSVQKYRYLPESESVTVNGQTFGGEIYIIEKSTLKELSFVDAGADSSTSAEIAAKQTNKENNVMTEKMLNGNQVRELRNLTARFENVLPAETVREIESQAIDEAWDVAKTTDVLIDQLEVKAMRNSRPKAPMPGMSRQAPGNNMLVFECALADLCNQKEVVASFDPSIQEASRSLKLASNIHAIDVFNDIKMIDCGTGINDRINAASTNGFSVVVSNIANKSLRIADYGIPQTHKAVSDNKPVNDFKTATMIRALMSNGSYELIAPSGEIKHATLNEDGKLEHKAQTRGRMFSVNRQTIRNDDLGAVLELVNIMGLNGYRTLNKDFWTAFKAATYFSDGNGNYKSGAATALSLSSLETAILLLREQVDANGDPAGQSPTSLVLPPRLEATGRALLDSIGVNHTGGDTLTTNPNGNPWHNLKLSITVEPLLGTKHGGSDTAWYLAGNQKLSPAMIVSLLDGIEHPIIETADADFSTLGMQFRGYFDYGIDTGDYQGCVKMKGEA